MLDIPPAREPFGVVLGRMLRDAGKSQSALANHLRISATYLSDIVRGNRNPLTNNHINATAEFLHVDPYPLYVAAIQTRGYITLAVDPTNRLQVEVGVYLQVHWNEFTDEQLLCILDILEGRKVAS